MRHDLKAAQVTSLHQYPAVCRDAKGWLAAVPFR